MHRRSVLVGGLALVGTSAYGLSTPTPFCAAISDYETASGGHIGVYAENTANNRSLSWRGTERFVMCSTFKASLAALVLKNVERHLDQLDSKIPFGPSDMRDWYAPIAEANLAKGFMTVGEMCAASVQHSDNTCANLLLTRVGGPEAITAFWRGIGDHTSRLDDPEPFLNRTPLGGVRDTTTPAAMTHTFRSLVVGDKLKPQYKRTLVEWLVGNKTGDNRLRAGLPREWVTGDKTGNNGKDAAGDVAVTWPDDKSPIIIAAYTRGGQPTAAQLDAVFASIARSIALNLA